MNDWQQSPPPDLDELKLALSHSPMLRALMDIAPDIMQQALKDETFPADAVLFREGEPGDRAYVIWSGELRIQHDMSGKSPLVMRHCGPGDVVGEVSLFDEEPRSATVITTEETRLISLSSDDLKGLLKQKPEASLALLQALSYRLRSSDESLVAASYSVDFLSKRLGGDSNTAQAHHDTNQAGLSYLFYELSDTANQLKDGVEYIKKNASPIVTDQVRGSIGLVETQAKRMAKTLERIRVIEILVSGDAVLDTQPVMVADMIDKIAAHLAPILRPMDIQVQINSETDIPMIRADRELLQEAFLQIMDNIARFSPPGGHIWVDVVKRKGGIQVDIADEGVGILSGQRQTIFEPFSFGADDEGHGFGLGLALARAVIQAHQGTIDVHDNPRSGSGALFSIELPIGN